MVSRPSVFSAGGLPFFYTSTCGNYSIPQQLVLATSPRHEGFYSAPTTGSSTLARRVAARIVTATDDGERLCKRYSLDDARRVVAEKARAEVYSVPVKADPGKSSYTPYRRPRRVRIKTSAYIAEYIVGFGHLWQIDEIAEEYCGKRSREAAYQFIYRNAWIAIVFGNKTFYIPRRTTPQFVAAAVEVFGDAAHTVEYARGGHKSDATE